MRYENLYLGGRNEQETWLNSHNVSSSPAQFAIDLDGFEYGVSEPDCRQDSW